LPDFSAATARLKAGQAASAAVFGIDAEQPQSVGCYNGAYAVPWREPQELRHPTSDIPDGTASHEPRVPRASRPYCGH
jgi:hypothetical protein